jgi:eukaryotic-like serine/threonine-protein kinase
MKKFRTHYSCDSILCKNWCIIKAKIKDDNPMTLVLRWNMSNTQGSLSIGAILQDRYLVKDVLGIGGFSAVYLVQDLKAGNGQGEDNLFALKELIDQDKQAHIHFIFEGQVLTRLNHPALPRIERVFEDDKRGHAYILMEYVDGQNLDVLRKLQPGKRYPLPEVLKMMAPIIEAITYLHAQKPPIIHRDIKPANIIIPKTGNKVVLVDFGIAKEYQPDSTTTAVRHCSPGYGAPEQYSIGTDTRTDVYGLGATFYTLLTGLVPVDALLRATQLADKGVDPLVPVQASVPDIPIPVATAISRAMSIGSDKRFASVDEFWQALNEHSTQQSAADQAKVSPMETDALRVDKQSSKHAAVPSLSKPVSRVSPPRRKLSLPVLILCAFFVGGGAGLSLSIYMYVYHSSGRGNLAPTPFVHTPTPLSTEDATSNPVHYPKIVDFYDGTAQDLLTNTTSHISLIQVQQNSDNIQGKFNGMHITGSFSGDIDTFRHIWFTVIVPPDQPSYFFEGTMRSDNNLVGNFCSIDAQGQCNGNYGLWSLSPGE